jgi:hypothetical protein
LPVQLEFSHISIPTPRVWRPSLTVSDQADPLEKRLLGKYVFALDDVGIGFELQD